RPKKVIAETSGCTTSAFHRCRSTSSPITTRASRSSAAHRPTPGSTSKQGKGACSLPAGPRSISPRCTRTCRSDARLAAPPPFGLFQPPAPQRLHRDARHVRLDVEDRRAVEHVHPVHAQHPPFPPQQFHHRQRDRV